MGFSNVWELLEPPAKILEQILTDNSGPWRSGRTHLLIDYNNLVVSNAGGNYFLTKKFSEYYWAGSKRNRFQGCIILSRRLGNSTSKHVSSSTLRKIARCRDVKPTVCKGEADVEIRRLCRELIANGDDVIVLSNDASLILGIPDTVYVANASKLSLVRNSDTKSGGYHLEGPILTVASLLKLLDQRMNSLKLLSDTHIPVRLGPSTVGVLCLVAALLGGEQERDSIEKAGNPFTIVKYVGSYLFGDREEIGGNVVFRPLGPNQKHRTLTKMGVLLSATALVLSWRLHLSAAREIYDDFEVGMHWPLDPASLLHETVIKDCVRKTLHAAVRGHTLFSLARPLDWKSFFPSQILNLIQLVQLLSLRLRNSIESVPWGSDGGSTVVYGCSRATSMNLDDGIMLNPEQSSVLDVRFELLMAPILSLITQVSKLISFRSLSTPFDVDALIAAVSGLRSVENSAEGNAFSSFTTEEFNRWLSGYVFPSVESDDSSEDEDEEETETDRSNKALKVATRKVALHWRSYPIKATYWPSRVLQGFKLFTAHSLAVDIANSLDGKYIPTRGRLETKDRDAVLWRVKRSWRDFGDILCLEAYPWTATDSSGSGSGSSTWSPLQHLPHRAALLSALKSFSIEDNNAKLPSTLADRERTSLSLTLTIFKTMIHRSEEDIHAAVDKVKRWWSRALKIGKYSTGCKEAFAEELDSSAVTMVVLVQTLISTMRVDCGFFGSKDDAQYSALLTSFIPKLFEACLLSPLFALAGEHLFYEGNTRVITESGKIEKWMEKVEQDVKVASGSIGAHPVGSPDDYLLTALSDKILKSLLKLTHSRNYASVAAWFDSQAISLSLRMHSIDRVTKSGVALNRVLNCDKVYRAFLRLDLATPTESSEQLAGAVCGLQSELDVLVLPALVGLTDCPQRAADYDYRRFFESFIENGTVQSDFQNPSGSNSNLKGGDAKPSASSSASASMVEPPSSEPPAPPSLQQPSIVFNMKDSWDDYSPNSPLKG